MDDRTQIEQVAQAIAAAIQAKDDRALALHLTPDFVLRRPGAEPVPLAEFLAGVRAQPVELLAIELEHVAIDLAGDTALATGVQYSRARLEGETVDDRQPFVDWFVKSGGRWQIRAALDYSDW